MTVGIYPGTFDPITRGHLDIIERSLKLVDKLIIAVADDIPKTPIFTMEERVEMVQHDIRERGLEHRVSTEGFKGLLVNFVQSKDALVIIRGLRAVSDFEYEFQLAAMNEKLAPEIETVFLPASSDTHFVASKIVKEVARLSGDISSFVSPFVAEKLKKFYKL